MSKVSVVIPARNEPYLQATINDILTKAREDIEVIAILDGYWPDPVIEDNQKVRLIHHGAPKGMRYSINAGARIASGEFLLKCDAHCAFDDAFDLKLKRDCQPNWAIVPRRYELDVKTWSPRTHRRHEFQYIEHGTLKGRSWPEYSERVKSGEKLIDLMTTQGSCWFMPRELFFEIGCLDDQNYGGMGREAQEVCLKIWLSGGRFVLSRNTWYAHWNKTREYVINDRAGKRKSVDHATDFWINNRWEKAKHDLAWLVDKFSPVPGWDPEKIKGVKMPNGEDVTLRMAKEAALMAEKPMARGETIQFIANKYGLNSDKSPICIKGMTRPGLYKLFAELGFKKGCEVGVQRGRNSKVMMDTIPGLKLYLVDPYKDCDWGNREYGERHHAKMRHMTHKRFKNSNVEYLEMFSIEAVQHFKDAQLDFVYIDGMHLYDFVMQDIILWSRKVKEGGIIAGHDYVKNRNVIGVVHAVDDYVLRHRINPLYITDAKAFEAQGDKSPSWFYVNPSKRKVIGRIKFCGRV